MALTFGRLLGGNGTCTGEATKFPRDLRTLNTKPMLLRRCEILRQDSVFHAILKRFQAVGWALQKWLCWTPIPSGKNWDNSPCPRATIGSVLWTVVFIMPARLVKFTRYCLTQWISKLPGSFKIHRMRQYLVNIVLFGIKNVNILK